MDVVAMDKETTRTYTIEVDRTVRQVLDLLTRKRGFMAVESHHEHSSAEEEILRSAGVTWLEILNARDGDDGRQCKWHYIIIETRPVDTHTFEGEDIGDDPVMVTRNGREIVDARPVCFPSIKGLYKDESGGYKADRTLYVARPSIDRLYEFCKGKSLRFEIEAETEDEANRIWLREMLRLGEDPGKWYASDDFSSITVSLRRVAEGAESEAPGSEADCGKPEAVDVAEFEVYNRLYGKLEHAARSWAYGDDIFVEYSISSDESVARYCATEFYSNHNWDADPANLLVVRFGAEASPKACSARDVQFSHPTKTTERKSDHKRFLVDSLTMANDIETKFSSGRGEDKHPDESVSANRTMDNPVDFDMWVDMHRKEIELL